MRVLRSFWLWCVALVCVLGFALVSSPAASGEQARITHLESIVKCPACEDLSVAQSDATSAIAVRNEIAARVHEGQSDNQILTALEDVYGTSILLSPPTSGLGALLWVVPVAGVVALVVAGVRLARRR